MIKYIKIAILIIISIFLFYGIRILFAILFNSHTTIGTALAVILVGIVVSFCLFLLNKLDQKLNPAKITKQKRKSKKKINPAKL